MLHLLPLITALLLTQAPVSRALAQAPVSPAALVLDAPPHQPPTPLFQVQHALLTLTVVNRHGLNVDHIFPWPCKDQNPSSPGMVQCHIPMTVAATMYVSITAPLFNVQVDGVHVPFKFNRPSSHWHKHVLFGAGGMSILYELLPPQFGPWAIVQTSADEACPSDALQPRGEIHVVPTTGRLDVAMRAGVEGEAQLSIQSWKQRPVMPGATGRMRMAELLPESVHHLHLHCE